MSRNENILYKKLDRAVTKQDSPRKGGVPSFYFSS